MTSDLEPGEEHSRLRWLLLLASLLAVAVLVIWWPGCRQYPRATSPESMRLIRLLYTACNTQDSKRLSRVEQEFEQAKRQGKLSSAEQDAFRAILDLAKAGEWKRAEQASFRFSQDQVR